MRYKRSIQNTRCFHGAEAMSADEMVETRELWSHLRRLMFVITEESSPRRRQKVKSAVGLLLFLHMSLTKERRVVRSVISRVRASIDDVATDRCWHNYLVRFIFCELCKGSPVQFKYLCM